MNRKMDFEVAGIVRLVRLCQSLSVLPQPGGLLDQDSYFVFLLEHVLLADQRRQELDNAKAKVK